MKNYVSLFFLLGALSSCAKPNYLTPETRAQTNSFTQVSKCDLQFRESKHCVLLSWRQEATSNQSGQLEVKIVRANALDDSPIPVEVDGQLDVVLWMPSMGHGSAPTRVQKVDQGSYLVENVFFIMPGDWEIRLQLVRESVIVDEAIYSFSI